MTDTPFIPFYTSDFLAGTSGLTAATKGVYITLLCLMYEAEGPLVQKWDTLARRCGCTLPAFKRAISDLTDDAKVEVTDEGIWSKKCEKHLAQRCERRNSAKAAANKRWEKIKQKQGKADANALRGECYPKPEPYIKEDTNVSSSRKPSRDEGFADFWDAWPSKKNKQDALKAWRKLTLEAKRDAYRAVVQGWFDRWQAASPDANPIHASTYLNKRRWEDTHSPQIRTINGGLTYDTGTHHSGDVSDRPQNRPETAAEQITRLAGLSKAQGHGGV